jgi:PAS domain-containing protein
MSGGSGTSIATAAELAETLRQHRARVAALRQAGPSAAEQGDLLAALTELDVAHEELRVAETELLSQQQQIDELLTTRQDLVAWRDRFSAAVPVPVIGTTTSGMVTTANAAAAQLLGVQVRHLVGKPLIVFVPAAERARLRRLIGEVARTAAEGQLLAHVTPRYGPPVPVSIIALLEHGESAAVAGIRWVMLPEERSTGAAEHPADATPAGLDAAAAFAEMCQLPVGEDTSIRQLLARVVDLGKRAVPDAGGLSVALGDPLEPDVQVADSAFAQTVDGVQHRAGEGPFIESFETGQPVMSRDVGLDRRWPRLSRLVAEVNVHAVAAYPIRHGRQVAGVINLYSTRANAFHESGGRTAELLTGALTAVIQDRQERSELKTLAAQLEQALTSRAQIDQAKGVLMGTLGVSADDAFKRLVTASQHRNVKVREIAAQLLEQSRRKPTR